MLTVYVGYDPAEQAAFDVCCYTIRKHWPDAPIVPLRHDLLTAKGLLTRPTYSTGGQLFDVLSNAPMSTEFANSRFLTPILHQTGWALFMDCDMVVLDDVRNIIPRDDSKAVYCVQHVHIPEERDKMCGKAQTTYQRKNWSSVILFNCDHSANLRLRLEHVNRWPGRELHALRWLKDSEIGRLDRGWNWLVDVQDKPDPLHIAHYTLGGPWFDEWQAKDSDAIWNEARREMDGHAAAAQNKAAA